jgi:hypothetical protein
LKEDGEPEAVQVAINPLWPNGPIYVSPGRRPGLRSVLIRRKPQRGALMPAVPLIPGVFFIDRHAVPPT